MILCPSGAAAIEQRAITEGRALGETTALAEFGHSVPARPEVPSEELAVS
jgi:hypothetical protein